MRTLAIVPARAGSTRVVGKNLRELGGRPLVCWAMDAASAASRVDAVVVSSDDDAVLALAEEHPGCMPLRRPAELATETSPAIEYVRHALASSTGPEPDAVVIVQPTSPFTRADDIDAALALLEQTPATSVVTVVRVEHAVHPAKLKVLEGDRLVPFLMEETAMAAQALPAVYVRNGSVYAIRVSTVAGGSLLGDDPRAVVMPAERSVDINEELDLAWAEFLLARGQSD